MVEKSVNTPKIDALLSEFQGGKDEAFSALCELFLPMLNASAYAFCADGCEADLSELLEEARIAFFRAATKYALHNGKVSFGLFARICVRRALISYCRAQKKRPTAHSLDDVDEVLLAEDMDPAGALIAEEKMADLYSKVTSVLSPLEHRVFDMYVEGDTTEAMAEKLAVSEKSVSNALYRMLKKLRGAL